MESKKKGGGLILPLTNIELQSELYNVSYPYHRADFMNGRPKSLRQAPPATLKKYTYFRSSYILKGGGV
jgi:hypothetical protein